MVFRDRSRDVSRLVSQLELLRTEIESSHKQERAAIMTFRGAVVTGLAMVLASAIAIIPQLEDDPQYSCFDERTRIARILKETPEVWYPLPATDPLQEQCQINEMVEG